MAAQTIIDLLKTGADDATALSTPGGTPLAYKALRTLVSQIGDALTGRGIAANDRVALVLDNGPEMAAAFLCVTGCATAAPLNPNYRADEFEFYLTDLRAKLLIVAKDKDSPCVAVADKLDIPIARLVPHPEKGAGTFTLEFPKGTAAMSGRGAAPGPSDIALVLHTSGTTSRPKIVPLSNANICASARHITRTLKLTDKDKGLVIMPLFHIHGLIAALSSPLSVGGEVCCSTGFNALKFFGWLGETKPTWYSGVPTMHQAILTRVASNQDVIASHRLRFIRSSSSSMPLRVISELESTFN